MKIGSRHSIAALALFLAATCALKPCLFAQTQAPVVWRDGNGVLHRGEMPKGGGTTYAVPRPPSLEDIKKSEAGDLDGQARKVWDVPEKAVELLKEACKLDPNNATIRDNLRIATGNWSIHLSNAGVDAANTGNEEKAAGLYRKALEIDPSNATAKKNFESCEKRLAEKRERESERKAEAERNKRQMDADEQVLDGLRSTRINPAGRTEARALAHSTSQPSGGLQLKGLTPFDSTSKKPMELKRLSPSGIDVSQDLRDAPNSDAVGKHRKGAGDDLKAADAVKYHAEDVFDTGRAKYSGSLDQFKSDPSAVDGRVQAIDFDNLPREVRNDPQLKAMNDQRKEIQKQVAEMTTQVNQLRQQLQQPNADKGALGLKIAEIQDKEAKAEYDLHAKEKEMNKRIISFNVKYTEDGDDPPGPTGPSLQTKPPLHHE